MTLTTVGAGIGACAALVPETAYSAVVASPAWTWFEPNTVVPKKAKTTKQSSGLAAGRMVDLAQRRVVVERSATVEMPLDWCQASHMTTLLNQISSTYASGAAGSQAALGGIYAAGARLTPAAPVYGYTHTFRNSIAGRSVAMQIGIPTTDGVLRQYDALGCKATKMAWSCKSGELLTCATSWDSRYLADPLIDTAYPTASTGGSTQTPYTQAAPSYAVAIPWDFANAQIQIGTSVAAASASTPVDGVTAFDVSVERKMKTGRQYYGNAGLKDEPITSDVVAITGTLASDFLTKTYFADAFYSDTPLSIIVTFSAGAMSATAPALQFVLNNVFLNDGSPAASGKDVVNTSFPFVALYDLVNEPLTVIMQTTDAAV
ncbi:hypothetical protein P3T36_006900 [Kitasatospora sp. MAP12-15]|uniref:hypothetical protein n=1 Tax=unclassified Kitasatospora TaxID=2633591 RepID=UPI00247382AA|nr:hypothetical protein [Kitasatospora sp. MAP12-44]MDH6111917.1 hypothetical protein [Kitasatospora sp. MAP12-44]